MEKFDRWHESKKIEKDGIVSFIKKYEPDSYEIKNEIKWLTTEMLKTCKSFKTPNIYESSIEKGFVNMQFIDEVSNLNKKNVLDNIINSAIELHNLYKFPEPVTRIVTTKNNYKDYLKNFVKYRIDTIESKHPEIKSIEFYIENLIKELSVKYFTIVHRDLRLRHMILDANSNINYLIDWEFSNISDYGQDLAKLIYDCVINHNMDQNDVTKYIVDKYSEGTKISKDEIINKINLFLPIIPLEHSAAFIKRAPEGYEKEVAKDIAFILALYDNK